MSAANPNATAGKMMLGFAALTPTYALDWPQIPPPAILGYDAAGTVEAVAPAAKGRRAARAGPAQRNGA